jgi:hypothetical protein
MLTIVSSAKIGTVFLQTMISPGLGIERWKKIREVNGRCDEGAWVMEIDATKKARIAALSEEMDRIHFVNSLYWQRGEAVTSEERAEHQRRRDRLEQVRAELAQLQVGRERSKRPSGL